MAGGKIIRDSLFESEKMAGLSDFEFRVWISLLLLADDAGRGDARPAIIKGRAFPLRERVTLKEIDAAVHGLAANSCVALYTVGGRPYYWFPTWSEHQRIRDCKPKYPAPEEADDNPPQSAATCGKSRPISVSISESISVSKSDSADALEGIDGELRKKLEEWLRYKSERRESYKPTGLHSLVEQVKKHRKDATDAQICSLIDESMANGWRGIIWDRLKAAKPQNPSAKTGSYKSLDTAELDELIRRSSL